MAVTPDKVQIGSSNDFLDGVAVDTAAGTGLFRETVVAADPENGEALARVRNAAPAVDDYGSVVRVAGAIDTGLIQPTTPADTQPVSGTITANQGASPYAVTQSGVWTVAVNNFPATQAVSGTVELGASTLAALESVSVQNTVTVQSTDLDIRNLSSAQDSVNVGNFPASPTTGSNSSVAGSTSQVTLLAANANRKGATIYNDSTLNALKISLGGTTTSTSFTLVIASTGYYEVPYGYTGIITGVFASATGAARITEVV